MLKQKIIVAVLKEQDKVNLSKWNTVGYRILDLSTKEGTDYRVKDKAFLSFLIQNKNNIINGTWDSAKVKGGPKVKFINGVETRYPVIDVATGKVVGLNPLVIAAEFKDGYLVVGPNCEMYEWTKKQAVAYACLNGVANGKYSSNGASDFISAISGSYEMINRKVITAEMREKKAKEAAKKAKAQAQAQAQTQAENIEKVVTTEKKEPVNAKVNISFNLFDGTRKVAVLNSTVEELYNLAKPGSYYDMLSTVKSFHRFKVLDNTFGLKVVKTGKEDLFLLHKNEYEVKERGISITYNTEVSDGKEPVNMAIVITPYGNTVKLTKKELSENLHVYTGAVIDYLRAVAKEVGEPYIEESLSIDSVENKAEAAVVETDTEEKPVDMADSILNDTQGYDKEELENIKEEDKSQTRYDDDFYKQLEPTFGGHDSVGILRYMLEERNFPINTIYTMVDEGKASNKYVPTVLGLLTINSDAVQGVYDAKLRKLCEKAIEPDVFDIVEDLIARDIDFDAVWDADVVAPYREHDTAKWALPLSLMEERLANYVASSGEELYGCAIEKDGTVYYNGQKLEVPNYRISGVNPGYITITSSEGKTRKVKSK